MTNETKIFGASQMGRRQALKALAAASMGMFAIRVHHSAHAAGNTPILYTWEGYEVPELHPSYVEKYGESPDASVFGDLEEALAKIRAGFKPDVSTPGAESISRWRDAGVLSQIDTTKLRHWPDLFDGLKNAQAVMAEGSLRWAVPMAWGNASVLFRTDLMPEYVDNHTWAALWDPKYSGRIAARDSAEEAVVPAALLLGIADPFNMNDEEIARVREKLAEQRELVRLYWTDSTSLQQGLASGELVAAYAWNDAYTSLKAEGVPVGYMTPKEGVITWVDYLCIMSDGSASEEQKYDLIDAMIAPESGAFMISDYGFGSANRKAFDQVDAEVIASLGWDDPEGMVNSGLVLRPYSEDSLGKIVTMFEEVKAGF